VEPSGRGDRAIEALGGGRPDGEDRTATAGRFEPVRDRDRRAERPRSRQHGLLRRSPDFEVVWLSEPRAKHSRNIRSNDGVAIAVYDSGQTWSEPDRGLQLFGTASELEPSAARDAQKLYAARFAAYDETEQSAYRFYVLRPHRLKLFDERELGAGMFVTARVLRGGRLVWERTEIYSSTK
jgi:uncharacterized protein YhbP (UPF0306 family)